MGRIASAPRLPLAFEREHALVALQAELAGCRACPKMLGPVVHGRPVLSRVMLVGQAPGPREGGFGRPFAWTAGKTLFRWIHEAVGIDEEAFRARVYIAAVARCFPGKATGGGDRKPAPDEVARCASFLAREVALLEPDLVVPVGALAIEQVTGHQGKLDQIVGTRVRARFHGRELDAIALPHPSGASTWHHREAGKALLRDALRLIAQHPSMRAILDS